MADIRIKDAAKVLWVTILTVSNVLNKIRIFSKKTILMVEK